MIRRFLNTNTNALRQRLKVNKAFRFCFVVYLVLANMHESFDVPLWFECTGEKRRQI